MTFEDDNKFEDFHREILDQFTIGLRKKFTLVFDGYYYCILEDDANPNDCDGVLMTSSEDYALEMWERAAEGNLALWSFDREVDPTPF